MKPTHTEDWGQPLPSWCSHKPHPPRRLPTGLVSGRCWAKTWHEPNGNEPRFPGSLPPPPPRPFSTMDGGRSKPPARGPRSGLLWAPWQRGCGTRDTEPGCPGVSALPGQLVQPQPCSFLSLEPRPAPHARGRSPVVTSKPRIPGNTQLSERQQRSQELPPQGSGTGRRVRVRPRRRHRLLPKGGEGQAPVPLGRAPGLWQPTAGES